MLLLLLLCNGANQRAYMTHSKWFDRGPNTIARPMSNNKSKDVVKIGDFSRLRPFSLHLFSASCSVLSFLVLYHDIPNAQMEHTHTTFQKCLHQDMYICCFFSFLFEYYWKREDRSIPRFSFRFLFRFFLFMPFVFLDLIPLVCSVLCFPLFTITFVYFSGSFHSISFSYISRFTFYYYYYWTQFWSNNTDQTFVYILYSFPFCF